MRSLGLWSDQEFLNIKIPNLPDFFFQKRLELFDELSFSNWKGVGIHYYGKIMS